MAAIRRLAGFCRFRSGFDCRFRGHGAAIRRLRLRLRGSHAHRKNVFLVSNCAAQSNSRAAGARRLSTQRSFARTRRNTAHRNRHRRASSARSRRLIDTVPTSCGKPVVRRYEQFAGPRRETPSAISPIRLRAQPSGSRKQGGIRLKRGTRLERRTARPPFGGRRNRRRERHIRANASRRIRRISSAPRSSHEAAASTPFKP